VEFSTLQQTDTYFHASSGRLKLRTIRQPNGAERAELIGYQRIDHDAPRWSRYSRVELLPEASPAVLQSLELALGVASVVRKRREAATLRRTRIHLDEVDGLGSFVELETVTTGDDDATAGPELAEIAALLRLGDMERVGGSYGDMAPGTDTAKAGR
jgi:adenylate cyclase class IV